MLSDVISELALFRWQILFTAVILAAAAAAVILLVRFKGWSSPVLKIFGILSDPGRRGITALAVILIRFLFVLACLVFALQLEMPHFCFGIMLAAALHLLLADPGVLLFDLPCTALVFGGLYIRNVMDSYMSGVKAKPEVIIMYVLLSVFILLLSLIEAVCCIRSIAVRGHRNAYRLGKVYIAGLAGVLAAGAVMAAIPYYTVNQVDAVAVRQEVFQHTSEGRVPYPAGSRVIKSGSGCVLESGGRMNELDRTPLYFMDEDRLMITNTVSIVQPVLSLTNRAANMSQVFEQDGMYYVTDGKDFVRVDDFFLFDGKDTYIFFEHATIGWGGNTLDISPFSYITVRYNQSIAYYDRETGSYTEIRTGMTNVSVRMECGASVDLSKDILYREDGQEQMLFLQPNLLEDLHK
jgi:hypothetical protein